MRGQDILDRISKQRSSIKMLRLRASKMMISKARKEIEDSLDNMDRELDKFEKEIGLARKKDEVN